MGITCYIAGPLTNGGRATDAEITANLARAVDAWKRVQRMGICGILPHLSMHLERDHGVRMTQEEWMAWCLAQVENASVVLRLSGESTGSDQEVELARALGTPVCYGFDELMELFEPQEPFQEGDCPMEQVTTGGLRCVRTLAPAFRWRRFRLQWVANRIWCLQFAD